MHRVVGGEEDVRGVDRNVADIMGVAASRLAPRLTDLAGPNRYLTGVGADDRFEGRRSVRRHSRIDVTRRRQRELPWQAVLAPVLCAPELAKRVVADDR